MNMDLETKKSRLIRALLCTIEEMDEEGFDTFLEMLKEILETILNNTGIKFSVN